MSQPDPAAETVKPPDEICYWCDEPVGDGGRCPSCGRMQTRICYCGRELEPGEDPCPECGADWQGVVRVRRRKRRRSGSLVDGLLFALLGVFIAVMLATLVNAIIGGMALRSAESTELPEDPGERLGLAWSTVSQSVSAMIETATGRLGGAVVFVLIGVLGAAIGLVYYLRREGLLGSGHSHGHASAEARRRRRV